MSFSANKNYFLMFAAIFIAIGITMGTGSLYRYAYSYNLIMAVTIIAMTGIVIYQQFLPIQTENSIITDSLNKSYSLQGLILLSFMLAIPLLSDIINIVPSLQIAIFYIAMLSISFFIDKDFRKKIIDIYLIIIIVLSIISILFLFLHLFTDVLSSLPNIQVINHSFYFLCSINNSTIWIRNQSIFFEPGAYGFHLIIATTFAYTRKKGICVIILIFTALTTFSTTVYIYLILLAAYHFIYSKHKFKIAISLISLILVTIILLISTGNDLILDIIQDVLFSKFSPSAEQYKSFLTRSIFSIEAFKMFIDHIILGAGHYATAERLDVVTSGLTVNTSGLAGLLAELGLFGVFCIFLYIRLFRHFKLFAIPIALIWLNGEFLQYSPLSIFLLAHSAEEFANNILPNKPSSLSKT